MPIIKAEHSKEFIERQKEKKTFKDKKVDIDRQQRLAEILNDSPHLVSLNGTEWEVRALRPAVQWLIAERCIKVNKAQSKSFGDILMEFSKCVPTMMEVLALALLNDKRRIYTDADESKGFSKEFYATVDTLQWQCNTSEMPKLLLEVLRLLDVNFFMETLEVMDMLRMTVTERKRMRTKAEEQKSSTASRK